MSLYSVNKHDQSLAGRKLWLKDVLYIYGKSSNLGEDRGRLFEGGRLLIFSQIVA